MEEKLEIDKELEETEEVKYLKTLFSMPFNLCATYLKFMLEKGLLPEFEEWRTKKVFEILGE